MRVDVLTIFPDYFAPLELSLIGKARATGVLDLGVHDLRQWTHDVHRTVDDSPYGGGPGMVMRPERGVRRSTRSSYPRMILFFWCRPRPVSALTRLSPTRSRPRIG